MNIYKGFLTLLTIGSLSLSACGLPKSNVRKQDASTPFSQVVKSMGGLLSGAGKKPVKSGDPRSLLTREAIDKSAIPVLLAGIETRNAYATLSLFGENRGVISWLTADGIGLYLRQGVLVSTRGLGQDLMAADVADVIRAIQTGHGTAIKIHDYLDGEDQMYRRSFYCTIRTKGREKLNIYGLSVATRHVVESCQNPELKYENDYWISSGNRIWQSRQWIGPDLQYLTMQYLSR